MHEMVQIRPDFEDLFLSWLAR